jgi:hypothetical protein
VRRRTRRGGGLAKTEARQEWLGPIEVRHGGGAAKGSQRQQKTAKDSKRRQKTAKDGKRQQKTEARLCLYAGEPLRRGSMVFPIRRTAIPIGKSRSEAQWPSRQPKRSLARWGDREPRLSISPLERQSLASVSGRAALSSPLQWFPHPHFLELLTNEASERVTRQYVSLQAKRFA